MISRATHAKFVSTGWLASDRVAGGAERRFIARASPRCPARGRWSTARVGSARGRGSRSSTQVAARRERIRRRRARVADFQSAARFSIFFLVPSADRQQDQAQNKWTPIATAADHRSTAPRRRRPPPRAMSGDGDAPYFAGTPAWARTAGTCTASRVSSRAAGTSSRNPRFRQAHRERDEAVAGARLTPRVCAREFPTPGMRALETTRRRRRARVASASSPSARSRAARSPVDVSRPHSRCRSKSRLGRRVR